MAHGEVGTAHRKQLGPFPGSSQYTVSEHDTRDNGVEGTSKKGFSVSPFKSFFFFFFFEMRVFTVVDVCLFVCLFVCCFLFFSEFVFKSHLF